MSPHGSETLATVQIYGQIFNDFLINNIMIYRVVI